MSPAIYSFLADVVLLVHAIFVLFAVLGGFLVLRHPRLAWGHLPTVLWAAWIELSGDICPLTPLENWLRYLAGEAMYTGSFIGRYLWISLYPAELTREVQIALGGGVLCVNLGIYVWLFLRWRRS